MKEKLKALDELISMCESAMAKPYKAKRMSAVVIKPEGDEDEVSSLRGRIESDEKDEDSLDKKSKLSDMLDDMDEEELVRLYEKLGV